MKDYSLCKHVDLKVDKEDKVVRVMKGPIYPYFGWSRKEQADIPRLRCSECKRSIKIRGYIIERDRNSRYTPKQST